MQDKGFKADGENIVWPVQIFYDGSCRICAGEMEHYRRKHHGGRLEFVDISDPQFDADAYGRTREEFMARMHVRDAAGRFWSGVAAFAVIWQALPGRRYRWLARLVMAPGVFQLAQFGYRVFARLRKYLPKTSRESCGLGHKDRQPRG